MQFNFFFNCFVPKAYILEVLDGALFFWTLWVFLLRLPNQEMTSTTFNTRFHIDLGWVCKWLNMYYSKIRIIIFLKIITISIWIILNNLAQTCRECNLCCYWTIILCIHPTFAFSTKLHEALSTHTIKEIHTIVPMQIPFWS